jgi:hypothetical protein
MDNERRTGARKTLGQEVVINHEKGLRFCKLQNISESGAFLDIGWGALTRNVPLELSINLPSNSESLRLPAQVARVSTNGTAVTFDRLDRQAQQILSEFIAA